MKIHVKIQDKIYGVTIGDLLARPIQAKVDGEIFEVWPEEMTVTSEAQRPPVISQVSHPTQPADLGKAEEKSSSGDILVKAPIPGIIIEIMVSTGDTVVYGQELCILEAMKMKNSIRAGKAGVIGKILVSAGDQVSQSQALMEYQGEEK